MGLDHLLLRSAIYQAIIGQTSVATISDQVWRRDTRLERGETLGHAWLHSAGYDYEYDANQRHELVAVTVVVAHRLDDHDAELLYVAGTASTDLAILLDPLFWRDVSSSVVEAVDVALEADPAPLEGNVIEYTVTATLLTV